MTRIAAIQFDVKYGKPEENFKTVEEMLYRSKLSGADLAILPEMWTTGYDLQSIERYAKEDNPLILAKLQKTIRQLQLPTIAGSMAEYRDNHVYNTSYVLNSSGEIVGKYSKCHLFRLMNEEKFFAPGSELSIYDLGFGPFSVVICYDLRFPELFRALALQGARLFILPAEWPYPRLAHWRILLQARAIENQVFVVAVNRVGLDPHSHFFGHSMIINPWGEVMREGEEQEDIIMGDINLEEVEAVRRKIPCWSDRRTDLY